MIRRQGPGAGRGGQCEAVRVDMKEGGGGNWEGQWGGRDWEGQWGGGDGEEGNRDGETGRKAVGRRRWGGGQW